MHMQSKNINTISALFLFAVAFLAGPYAQLDHMSLIHGDFGDARLNNYFLENIFLFIQGTTPSLIDIQFFYPFPYVLGFSDNLLGASPVYLVARALTDQPDTAFQIWYLGGYLANYLAAFYALRRLDAGPVGSAAGALIFTFALPVVGHSGHAQLQYRFGVPLASALFILVLKQKEWRLLVASAGWLVWPSLESRTSHP